MMLRRNHRALVVLLLLLLLAGADLHAQEENADEPLPISFGLLGGFGLYSYSGAVDVSANPALGGGACGVLSEGSGSGPAFGAFVEYRASESVGFGLRGLFEDYSGTMTNALAPTFRRAPFGNLVEIEAEHRLELDYQAQSFEAYVAWQPLPMPLRIFGGPKVAIPSSPTFVFAEELVGEGEAAFLNGTRRQEYASGSLDGAVMIGLHVGLDYALPMGALFTLEPSIVGYLYPTAAISGEDGPKIAGIRPTIGIRYSLPSPAPDPPLLAIAEPRTPPAPPEQVAPLALAVEAFGIAADGSERSGLPVDIRTERRIRDVPMLPYVFFDAGSSAIPDRYGMRAVVERPADELSLYRSILNVVGTRMRTNDGEITITGTVDREELTGGKRGLARQRAEAARDYLVKNWGVDADRINVASRGLPARAANSALPGAAAENRRIEIAGEPALLGPVRIAEEESALSVGRLGLRFPKRPSEAIESWTIETRDNVGELTSRSGTSGLPPTIDVTFDDLSSRFATASEIEYVAMVENRGDRVVRDGNLAIERTTEVVEQPLFDPDGRLPRPVLFAYNSDRIDAEDRRNLEELRDRLAPGASLRIIGFADDLGAADYNRALSERRAKAVATIFPDHPTTIVAGGEQPPIAGDRTPEARLLARTVRIEIVNR